MEPFLGAALHVSHRRSESGEHNGHTDVAYAESGEASQRKTESQLQGPVSDWITVSCRHRGSKPKRELARL